MDKTIEEYETELNKGKHLNALKFVGFMSLIGGLVVGMFIGLSYIHKTVPTILGG